MSEHSLDRNIASFTSHQSLKLSQNDSQEDGNFGSLSNKKASKSNTSLPSLTKGGSNSKLATRGSSASNIGAELVEVVASANYESSKFEVRGKYHVKDGEAGQYVMIFDNTFSV